MQIWQDPIVEEIHQIRAQLAAAHGNDIAAIVRHYQTREAASSRIKVSFAPRRPHGFDASSHIATPASTSTQIAQSS